MNAILCRTWMLLFLIIPMCFGLAGAEKGVETAPSDSLHALGEDQLRKGMLDGAIETFALLVEAYPKNAVFRSRLGSAHLARGDFDTAQTAFEHARQLNPQLPDPYVGLGEVYVKRPAMGIKAFFNFRKAVGEARRATKIDSTYAPAYRLLGDLYERFRADHEKAIGYYMKYLELEPDSPDELYYFGLACVQAGQYDPLNTHLAPALERQPNQIRLLPLVAQGYSYREQYEMALSHFERYLQSLSEREHGYYTDISLIASHREMQAYQSLAEETERLTYLKQFWLRRDPDVLTPINERIIEHYRRVWYARTFFSQNTTPWDQRGVVYIRYGEPDFRSSSDKPNLLISPEVEAVRTRMAVDMYGPNAAYLTFTGPVFPIRKHNLNTGESIRDLRTLDPDTEIDIEGVVTAGDVVDLTVPISKESGAGSGRAPFDQAGRIKLRLNFQNYAPVTMDREFETVPWETWTYTQLRDGIEITFTDEMNNGRYAFAPLPPMPTGENQTQHAARMMEYMPGVLFRKATATTPDYYRPGIERDALHFYYDLADFRGEDGKTSVEVYYGVPPGKVEIATGQDEFLIQVQSALALANEGHTEIFRAAEIFSYQNTTGFDRQKGAYIPDMLRVQVPPGTYELQVQLKDMASRRVGVYKQTLKIQDYGTDQLRLSGILLASSIGESGTNDRFQKGDLWIEPMPSRAYQENQKVYAYFEIYNLKRDTFGQTRYRIQYRVRHHPGNPVGVKGIVAAGFRNLFKRRKPQVSVTYEQVGSQPTEREYIELDLSKAETGVNVLEVIITDLVTGNTETREVAFLYGRI